MRRVKEGWGGQKPHEKYSGNIYKDDQRQSKVIAIDLMGAFLFVLLMAVSLFLYEEKHIGQHCIMLL